MTTTFEWKGDKVLAAMEQAKAKALLGAAVIVHGQAVELAAVDTGNLKNSLSWTTGGKVGGLNSVGGTPASPGDGVNASQDEDTAYIGTNVEYAPHVEFGTSKAAAQPYLRPALDVMEADVKRYIREIIADHLKGATK